MLFGMTSIFTRPHSPMQSSVPISIIAKLTTRSLTSLSNYIETYVLAQANAIVKGVSLRLAYVLGKLTIVWHYSTKYFTISKWSPSQAAVEGVQYISLWLISAEVCSTNHFTTFKWPQKHGNSNTLLKMQSSPMNLLVSLMTSSSWLSRAAFVFVFQISDMSNPSDAFDDSDKSDKSDNSANSYVWW